MKTHVHLWVYRAQFFLKWEIFQRKCRESQITYFMFNNFFRKSYRLWDNFENVGVQKFYKNLGTTSKFYAPEGDMKPVPYWGPRNIMRHFKKMYSSRRPSALDFCTSVVGRC